jgi:hypothetical protein
MKRTFPIRIESARVYIAFLIDQGFEFHVKPFTNRIDVTIKTDDPLYFPNEEAILVPETWDGEVGA